MYSVVSVIEVNEDSTVLVGCDSKACQGCKAEMFCNTRNQNSYLALNIQKLPIKPGDFVQIYLPTKKTILSTILVFALPLVLFPLGYLSAKFLLKIKEVGCALFGLLTMCLAFCITALISIRKKRDLMPQITKII